MIRMNDTAKAWGTPQFEDVLRAQLKGLGAGCLPLQTALSVGNYALEDKIEVMIISICERGESISVRAGIFYTGILTGCSCADDPTPVEENHEYCEVQLDIDRKTAEATVHLLE